MISRELEDRLRVLTAQVAVDKTHDLDHASRVWRICRAIVEADALTVDTDALMASAYLHDIVSLPKESPDRSRSSRLAADRAEQVLLDLGFPPDRIPLVKHAITAHSFSAGVPPETLEAKVLQDADRIEALGAIGIARAFYIGGMMGSRLFDPLDPAALRRPPDDSRFVLDHFAVKLFKLAGGMHTKAGRRMAQGRVDMMRDFVETLLDEVSERELASLLPLHSGESVHFELPGARRISRPGSNS